MKITLNLSNDDYEAVMARIDELMELNAGDGPLQNSPEEVELDLLSMVVERYEISAFSMETPG